VNSLRRLDGYRVEPQGIGGKVGFEFTVDPGSTDTLGDATGALNPFD
jgi:hypothetical protein